LSPIAETLKTQLEQLPQTERAELAYFLLRSLDNEEDEEDDEGWAIAWKREIERRVKDVKTGRDVGEPAGDLFARLREKRA
jgi:putative addiction module component (TIGR02574 family)